MAVSTWVSDCNAGRAMAANMLATARIDGSDGMAADAFFHLKSRLAAVTGEDMGFLAYICERALAGEVAISGGLLAYE
ncbi:hypothetical protein ACO2Q1_10215 [Brevundimonas sp. VNH65]|uniref:hypothetical protein n=1 Tax=Brevundimonas sp. VNH65 TaxID=3400917 RepID=UPI003C1249CC